MKRFFLAVLVFSLIGCMAVTPKQVKFEVVDGDPIAIAKSVLIENGWIISHSEGGVIQTQGKENFALLIWERHFITINIINEKSIMLTLSRETKQAQNAPWSASNTLKSGEEKHLTPVINGFKKRGVSVAQNLASK